MALYKSIYLLTYKIQEAFVCCLALVSLLNTAVYKPTACCVVIANFCFQCFGLYHWLLTSESQREMSIPLGVCWWLKKGWVPVNVFNTDWLVITIKISAPTITSLPSPQSILLYEKDVVLNRMYGEEELMVVNPANLGLCLLWSLAGTSSAQSQ